MGLGVTHRNAELQLWIGTGNSNIFFNHLMLRPVAFGQKMFCQNHDGLLIKIEIRTYDQLQGKLW